MRTAVAICVITASAFIGSSAWAGLVKDQFQESYNYSCTIGTPGGPTVMAQTFKAGVSGTLAYIQIGNTSGIIFGSASWPVVEIRNAVPVQGTDQYQPGSTTLGGFAPRYLVPYYDFDQDIWATPDMSDSPGPLGWTPLIPFNIRVQEGQMYSIVLSSSDPSGTVSVSAVATDPPDDPPSDPYSRGALWAYDDDIWKLYTVSSDLSVYDMQFRTYVVPVPLPAGVWLGICAVGVVGWHLRHRTA